MCVGGEVMNTSLVVASCRKITFHSSRIVKDDDYDDVLFDGWIRSKHVDWSKLKNPVSLLRPSPGEIHVMALLKMTYNTCNSHLLCNRHNIKHQGFKMQLQMHIWEAGSSKWLKQLIVIADQVKRILELSLSFRKLTHYLVTVTIQRGGCEETQKPSNMDRQSKTTGLEKRKAPECVRCLSCEMRIEGVNVEPTGLPDGPVQGWFMDLKLSRKRHTKKKREKDRFQCFFPTCQTSLMDVLTVIKKKARAVDSFRHAARSGMKREHL